MGEKLTKINNPDASVGAQCSTFRTVCTIRHGCRWFQTETSFLLCKKLAVKNVQGCIFLTRWLQSGFNTLYHDAERRGIKPSARVKLTVRKQNK